MKTKAQKIGMQGFVQKDRITSCYYKALSEEKEINARKGCGMLAIFSDFAWS